MDECENCKKLEAKLEILQEEYDVLHKTADNACYDASKAIDEIKALL